jgi:phage-related protein
MPLSRPMPSIARNVHELRIQDRDATWRIVYRRDPDAILLLEVFSKKSRATPQSVIRACRSRLSAYYAL